MSEAVPETIDKVTQAAQVLSRPNVFVAVLACAALGATGFLGWHVIKQAESQLERIDAQTEVLKKMADKIGFLEEDFRAAGISKSKRAVSAVDRE